MIINLINRTIGFVGVCLLLTVFTSCFKKDDKVVLPPPGNLEYGQVNLGENYNNQVFLKFSNFDTLGNSYTSWDMAFDASPGGYHIWINGGNQALAANMGNFYSFDGIKDTLGAAWRWDSPDWNPALTAIGDWTSSVPPLPSTSNQVPVVTNSKRTEASQSFIYLFDRGPAFSATDRFWKIIFLDVNQSSYTIKYARLDGSGENTKTILKNPTYNYAYFSFDGGGKTINLEPVKKDWDILFTRYRYIFYNPTIPYLVEGVLINPSNTSVACDSVKAYGDIDYAYAKNLPYSTARDIIGWGWKVYSFSTAQYTVKPALNFVIKDSEGFYWKVHFLGYYNSTGEKGNPKFEYQRL